MEKLSIKGAGHVFFILLSMCVISLNFLDPINWPKQIAVATSAPLIVRSMYLSSSNESRRSFMRESNFKLFTFAALMLLITALFSDANVFRTLWGSWGRNNGILTLLSLMMISMCYAFYCRQSLDNLERVCFALSIGLMPTALYGLAQYFKLDPIQWSTAGQVFGPFGNTNFASAIWGAASLLTLQIALRSGKLVGYKIFFMGTFLLYSFVSYSTNSIQGPLMIIIGIAAIIFIEVSGRNRRFGLLLLVSYVFVGLIVGLGMFGIGPLSAYIYQYTLKLRSFYWLSGLRMGLENPIFGVGVDSYGDFFRLFRPIDAALATGIDLTTNNSHNSFIQLFATLGIFGSLGILALWLVGLYRAFRVFLNPKENRILRSASVIFILLWIISMISIDNIAIATLNYVFLGIALSMTKKEVTSKPSFVEVNKKPSKVIQRDPWKIFPITLIAATAFVFTISVIASSGDRKVLEILKRPVIANDQNSLNLRAQSLIEVSKERYLMEAHFRYLAKALYDSRYLAESLQVVDSSLKKYPNDFSSLDLKASTLENLNRRKEAIEVRRKQIELEPNHPLIWLNLALDLKENGEAQKAKAAYIEARKLKKLTSGSSLIELEKLSSYFD
jgi:tetratricopeptide (TPR) repeat protein